MLHSGFSNTHFSANLDSKWARKGPFCFNCKVGTTSTTRQEQTIWHPYEGRGFSLLEILIAIAVIAVLSSLLLPQVFNLREGAQLTLARQQQAELQTALGSWVVAKSSQAGGLAAARSAYTGTKLALLESYLQESTYARLQGDGDLVTSEALDSAGAYLQFSPWSGNLQPAVEWINR